MKKTIFILAMLLCPNLYAATLTTNTVPYVCQGGASPQLCNSNVTTDSNGNLLSNSIGGMANVQTGVVTSESSFTITGLSPGVRYKLIVNYTQNVANDYSIINFNGDSGSNYVHSQMIVSINGTNNVTGYGGASQTYGYFGAYTNSGKSAFTEVTFEGNSNNSVYMEGTSVGTNTGIETIGNVYTGSSPLSSLTIAKSGTSGSTTMTGTWALYQLN